jgi:hypothetical protein
MFCSGEGAGRSQLYWYEEASSLLIGMTGIPPIYSGFRLPSDDNESCPCKSAVPAVSRIGVFCGGCGDRFLAKKGFPHSFLLSLSAFSAHSAVNSFVEAKAPMSLPEGPHV